MDTYSRGQFSEPFPGFRISDTPWTAAGPDDICFLELQNPAPALARAEELIVYRWNRHYPSDQRIALPPEGWRLIAKTEFLGYSHDKITKEVYR